MPCDSGPATDIGGFNGKNAWCPAKIKKSQKDKHHHKPTTDEKKSNKRNLEHQMAPRSFWGGEWVATLVSGCGLKRRFMRPMPSQVELVFPKFRRNRTRMYHNTALFVGGCWVSLTGRFHRQSAAGWPECTVAGPRRVRHHAVHFSGRSSTFLVGHARAALPGVRVSPVFTHFQLILHFSEEPVG